MKIKFVPQNIELEINPGQSVLDLAQQNDIHIQSVCKGIPSCAECRIYIKEGDHNVMPPQPKELELIGTAYFVDQRRLSCQLRCFGDVTIDLTEQNEKQNKSTKNPQGRYVKEREDSHARMGNLLEELTDVEQEIEKELEEERKKNPAQDRSGGQKQKLDSRSFYNVDTSSEKNKSNNQNQRSNRHSSGGNRNSGQGPNKNSNAGQGQNRNSNSGQNPQRNANQGQGANRNPNHGQNLNRNQNANANQSASPTEGAEPGSSAKRNRNRRRNKNRNKNSGSGAGGNAPTNPTPPKSES